MGASELLFHPLLAELSLTYSLSPRTSMLHLSDIDTKLPSDIGDELMGSGRGGNGGETMMTSLIIRIKISKLAEKIVSRLSRRQLGFSSLGDGSADLPLPCAVG